MTNYTLSNETHSDIVETLEDTVQYLCDEFMVSGECVWTVIECLALAKQEQLKGNLK